MRTVRELIPLLALLVAGPLAAAPANASSEEEEAELLRLEEAWNQAHLRGDLEALDRLWHPDLTVTVPAMRPFSKADLVGMWGSMKVEFTRYETSDVHVWCDDATAVVRGRLQRSRDFGGRVRDEDWLFTKTYTRTDVGWQVVAYHASTTP